MALVELLGSKVQGKGGEMSVEAISNECEAVGIYFSAHWCPPCRGFTPALAAWYEKLKAKGKKLEIVFVSSDRDQSSFDGYYKEMPWLAVPFEQRDKKEELGEKYGVRGIPTLVFVNAKTGELITTGGRGFVMSDPEGEKFPNYKE